MGSQLTITTCRKFIPLFDSLSTFFYRIRRFASLADQALVSGGNFLTIAICAHMLPLPEQGKFIYVFASYMALLLLNVAGIFQGAAVRAPSQDGFYKSSLARMQLLQALFFSLLVCVAWFFAGGTFGWQATATEAWMLFAFLVVQQLADFDRRAAYIFSGTNRAILSSAILYLPRVIGLLVIKPDTVSHVLMVLVMSALVPAVLTTMPAIRRMSENTRSWIVVIQEHLMYSRLFIIGAPLGWLWAYIPIFLLGIFHGKEQAALLASIRGISNMANVLMEQIETKVVADWARTSHTNGSLFIEGAVARLLKIGLVFWLCGMVVIAVLGREIVVLVLGNLYGSHWHLLVIGWLGYGIYFLVRVLGIKHRTLGNNRVEFVGNLFGVLVASVAGLVIIHRFEAMGAAWLYIIIAVTMWVSQQIVLKSGKIAEK